MIFITENNIPVACYDGVSPMEALRAHIAEFHALANIPHGFIDREEGDLLVWKEKRYAAVICLENF
jgi:hypothetical protein